MSTETLNTPNSIIVERLSFENCANCYKDIYVKSENVMIHCFSGSFQVTCLNNAGKRGKTCAYASGCFDRESCQLLNILSENNWQARSLFNPATLLQFKYGELREIKAVSIFSPFSPPLPLKALPKKWNIELARRALSNGQAKDCIAEMDFDGMTDSHEYPHAPCSIGAVLHALNTFNYGVSVADSGRVHVGNSASEYSFLPVI